MVDLNTQLVRFIDDPENPDVNLWLAKHYHSIGQTASAISYYVRTAERTEDKTLMYACLLFRFSRMQKQLRQGDVTNSSCSSSRETRRLFSSLKIL